MKKISIISASLLCGVMLLLTSSGYCQSSAKVEVPKDATAMKLESDQQKKAAEWIESLNINDKEKESRLKAVIFTHLVAIVNWHNNHSFTVVPVGINPLNGKPLSELDRQIIVDSSIPKEVHDNLMVGLQKDLSKEQVEAILDKYTVGKVAFTMNGYHAIVPDLTPTEETVILGFMKEAREQAIDYKNMKQISAIFEIYKTKSEQYLNANGRSWKVLYKAYTDAIKAKKAEAAKGVK